jgi:competence protein ComGC
MRYDLIVTEIINENSRKVLAHQLARDPEISFHDALVKLQKLPVVLFKDLDEQAMTTMVGQYLKYGVRIKAVPAQQKSEVEVKHPTELHDAERIKVTQDDPKSTISENVQIIMRSEGVPEKGGGSQNQATVFKNPNIIEENKKSINERTLFIIFLLLFIVVSLILSLISSGKKDYHALSGSGNSASVPSVSGLDVQTMNLKKKSSGSELSKRKSISVVDKKKSSAMCDSAKNAGNNVETLINFYKIAISFNKYNLDAWFGLLDAYKSAGRSGEYQQAENQMKELFGDKVFDISSQVKRFGEIEDLFENENGVLVVKYRSPEPLDRSGERVYSLIKILHTTAGYQSLSIEIAGVKAERMLVHVRPGMEIATFADFKKNASVMIFNKKEH